MSWVGGVDSVHQKTDVGFLHSDNISFTSITVSLKAWSLSRIQPNQTWIIVWLELSHHSFPAVDLATLEHLKLDLSVNGAFFMVSNTLLIDIMALFNSFQGLVGDIFNIGGNLMTAAFEFAGGAIRLPPGPERDAFTSVSEIYDLLSEIPKNLGMANDVYLTTFIVGTPLKHFRSLRKASDRQNLRSGRRNPWKRNKCQRWDLWCYL